MEKNKNQQVENIESKKLRCKISSFLKNYFIGNL